MGIEYAKVPTSLDVYRAIYEQHKADLVPWSSFSDPDGQYFGPRMDTVWALRGADAPLIGIVTTWERYDEQSNRVGEQHAACLYRVTKDEDQW